MTVFWHERSSEAIVDRYGGSVWVDERTGDMVDVASPKLYRTGDRLPGGLVAYDAVGRKESVLWLEEHGALFTGDIIHGSDTGVRLVRTTGSATSPQAT